MISLGVMKSLSMGKGAMRILAALLGLLALSFSMTGCATTGTEGTKVSSNSSESIGPDYYQSDDNPFHAD
jgi:hypothetical protein